MIAAGLVTPEEIQAFTKNQIIWRDEIWTRAGEHILTQHKPNLLLFHLLTTDSAQHTYGARSLAGNTAFALADAKIGRLIEATKRAGIFERTTFIIVSDHGFKTYKRSIRPNALLKAKGLGASAWVIPEGGTAMVYVTKNSDKKAIVDRVKTELRTLEGVARIIESAEFGALGLPDPATNNRMADLVLAAAAGYSFSGATDGEFVTAVPAGSTPGAHGYLSSDPEMQAIFVACGAGIRKGASAGTIRNLAHRPDNRPAAQPEAEWRHRAKQSNRSCSSTALLQQERVNAVAMTLLSHGDHANTVNLPSCDATSATEFR